MPQQFSLLQLRLPIELHGRITAYAKAIGASMNQTGIRLIERGLTSEFQQSSSTTTRPERSRRV